MPKEGLKIVGSDDRKPSASADEQQYQHIPGLSFPTAARNQQGTLPDSEQIEEPSYQEHGTDWSGQQPIEAPSFYPADLFDRQLQEERGQPPQIQPRQKNNAHSSNQGQQAYGAVAPVPAAIRCESAIASESWPDWDRKLGFDCRCSEDERNSAGDG